MTLPVPISGTMLKDATAGALNALSDELQHAYAHRQIFRTDTEARVSVLDEARYPTPAARYWQALKEQVVMLEQLAILSFEYRRNEVSIKRLMAALAVCNNELDREDIQINLDECLFKRAGMRSVAGDRAREVEMWSRLKAEADDGSFDKDDANTHQLVSYTARFAIAASTVQPGQLSADEFLNLSGQLQTALRRCKAVGAMGELNATLPPAVADQITRAL